MKKFFSGILLLNTLLLSGSVTADSAKLLQSSAWRTDAGIKTVPGNKLRIIYSGNHFRSRMADGPAIPVKAGTFLRGDLTFRKRHWDFSTVAPAHVKFFNRSGKWLSTYRFDRSNIKGYSPFSLIEFQSPAGNKELISYFNFWQVPSDAAFMRFGWTFRYNAAEIEIEEIRFSTVDGKKRPWSKAPEKKASLTFPEVKVTDAEVDRILAQRQRITTSLIRSGDRIELLVNGKKVQPFFMHNTPYPGYKTARWTQAFNRIGFQFSTVWVNMGRGIKKNYPVALKEDGTIDVSGWRKAIREHLKAAPEAHIILALNIFPRDKWLAENDDQLMKNGKGENFIFGYPYYPLGKGASNVLPKGNFSRYPSFFSEKYTAHICGELEKVLTELEKYPESKVVAGLYLEGGDDAQFRLPNIHTTPDLSPLAVKGFRDHLRKKYRTDEALQKAWGDPGITFDKVHPPVKPEIWPDKERYYAEGGRDTKLADYKQCYAFSDRRFKSAIRKSAKKAMPRVIVGGYDCAYGISGSWGHTGLFFGKNGIDDDADFYLYIPSYGRDRDNADMPLGAYQFTGSLVLHKKLGIMELDVRNPEIGPLYFGHYRSANYVSLHNAESFAVSLRHLAMQALVSGGGFHYYNLQPHWCRTPRAMKSLEAMHKLASEARGVPLTGDRIALMIDEDSNHYSSTHPGWVPSFFNYKNLPIAAVQRSGVKFNYYLAADALHPEFKAPQVLFFADASTLTPEKVKAIRQRFGNSKRVIVWHGAPGFLTCGNEKKISEAVNFKLFRMPDYGKSHPVPLVISQTADPIVKSMKGFFMQEFYTLPPVFSPHWRIDDPQAAPLAVFYGTNHVGMAVKRHKEFTEVFIGQPGAVTPQLFRNLAREAGIQPSLETDDIFLCGAGLLGVGASTGSGIRKIRIPKGFSKAVPLSGHKILRQDKEHFECFIPYRDMAVFKLL